MYVATYNCGTLQRELRLEEIEEELSKMRWDILGICKTKRTGEERRE